ncbi:unnamed protein product [Alopecurus aequalis]
MQRISVETIQQAVRAIIPYLEDTSNAAHRAIYFDGWSGLVASVVLKAIAEHPPPSLLTKFNKIIHVDCSRWKSRRALQRTIVQELKLPHRVMDVLDRQDAEDDFIGLDEGSRSEIRVVGTEIYLAVQEHKCLVVFNNGSENTIELDDFGIPLSAWFGNRVLWTFRGRLRLSSDISENVDTSHLHLYDVYRKNWVNYLLQYEATEIVGNNEDILAVQECCLYLLSLNSQGGDIMDYNWATHASNYWVCDGILEGGREDKAWEVAAALHQQIHIEDYASNLVPSFGGLLETPPKRWILARNNSDVHPLSTSFFLVAVTKGSDPPLHILPNDMFHQSNKLRVLKLCHCTFSFSSPPFLCCQSLRFLGLDGCEDQGVEEVENKDRPAVLFFQSLWVLDICNTYWDLASSPEIIDQMAPNIREVHIKKGSIWSRGIAWRKLRNLRKLQVIAPTCTWETGEKDEFTDMVKIELLDLSGNSTIQVLPSLSGATKLKTLVLDGCVGLEHVEGLPVSLESFSLNAGPRVEQNKEAKISIISLAGCTRLVKFRLCGSLPNLEDLDLSGTLVKTLVLKDQVVQAPSLQQITLLGCLQLHAILWPEEGLPKHTELRIDSLVCCVQTKLHQAYATVMDIRFVQSLVLESINEFCWKSTRFHLNLCVPSTTRVEGQTYKEKTRPRSSWQICPPQPKSLIPNSYRTYTDIAIDNIAIQHDRNKSASQFQPLGRNVEIGDGISNTRVESLQGMKAIIFVMSRAESLHVHDNSSIVAVIPQHMISIKEKDLTWRNVKRCHVARCPKMHTVFTSPHSFICFEEIESFWAADLLMAHCIWSKAYTTPYKYNCSFTKLQSIHLYSCLRLTFVLQLCWSTWSYFPNLETLHIVNCGDLRDVFPVEPELLTTIATDYRKGILEFPKLKHIYLHELYKLQHICEAKMFAPKLESVRLRGCWGLRRLPAVGRYNRRRPVVDCEKDWWEKLEWDGLEAGYDTSLLGWNRLEAGHDPSLFELHHSSYYKKPLPRVSVLR